MGLYFISLYKLHPDFTIGMVELLLTFRANVSNSQVRKTVSKF